MPAKPSPSGFAVLPARCKSVWRNTAVAKSFCMVKPRARFAPFRIAVRRPLSIYCAVREPSRRTRHGMKFISCARTLPKELRRKCCASIWTRFCSAMTIAPTCGSSRSTRSILARNARPTSAAPYPGSCGQCTTPSWGLFRRGATSDTAAPQPLFFDQLIHTVPGLLELALLDKFVPNFLRILARWLNGHDVGASATRERTPAQLRVIPQLREPQALLERL